jgi:hypothetical protein
MSRRTDRAAERAAAEASEAARTLASRGAEVRRAQATEPAPEASPEPKAEVRVTEAGRVEKLLKGRAHVQAMDEILEKREKAEPVAEEPKAEPKAEPVAEAVPAAPEPAAEPVAAPETPPAPVMVKQKVDGEEYEVSQTEIDEAGGPTAWRIAKANENRLNKANATLAEIRRAQAELAEWSKKSQAPAQPSINEEIAELEKKRAELAGTFDFEAAAKVQDQIYEKKLQQQRVDPNQIIQQAAMFISNQQAVTQFRRDFADIMSDPMLSQWALTLERQRMAEIKGSVDWNSFYSKLGNDIRSRLGRQSQPAAAPTVATPGTPSQPSEKEARKASITTLPTAAARAELPKEAKELTPDEERKAWIAEQKKARGLG